MMIANLYRNNRLTFFLLVMLGISLWLTKHSMIETETENISRLTTPDTVMTDVQYLSFDKNGNPENHITAAKITHYPDQDRSILKFPYILAQTDTKTVWKITAIQGTARHGFKVFYLKNKVTVLRIQQGKGVNLTLYTNALTAFPVQKQLHTEEPVTILQSNSIIHAIGLTADLKTADIQLLSEVRGTYQMNK